ncbi:MAG: nucleoside hydrolase [Simkaniaceae bacterium]|nr:MAG: nucleoside hydrolase [Simkaniaceae bacterium]
MLRKVFIFFGALFSLTQLEGKITVDLSHPTVLIIDTDADIDDMMAILYLLKTPRVDIKAITTVGDGMTHWEKGAKNISNLLELAGRSHIPVAYGERKSLSPAGTVPSEWRTEADAVAGIKLPINPVQPVRVRASKYMTEIIQKSPTKITLLCIGPMTNVAIALDKTPEIKENIERIYIMGGAISTSGNIVGRPQGFRNQVAEYNILLDAKAASDVFNSGVPITLIPLDATEYVPITKEFFDRLSKMRKTPSANFVYEVIKPYATMQKRNKSYFWDPLAAVIMTHPEVATYRDLKLTVNMKKGPEYGRLMMTKMGPNIQVATAINEKAFYNLFLDTLNRPTNLKQNHNESK